MRPAISMLDQHTYTRSRYHKNGTYAMVASFPFTEVVHALLLHESTC